MATEIVDFETPPCKVKVGSKGSFDCGLCGTRVVVSKIAEYLGRWLVTHRCPKCGASE